MRIPGVGAGDGEETPEDVPHYRGGENRHPGTTREGRRQDSGQENRPVGEGFEQGAEPQGP